jgi:predicted enzyme related to lactoylglutathione lyase
MRTMFNPGDPCWIELFTTDTDTARQFYADLFGWTARDSGPEYGGYVVFERDSEPVAGLMHNDGSSGGPSQWTVYLAAEDAEKTAELAQQHGAHVIVGPMQVGDQGSMAFLVDPAGAAIGIWQADQHRGFAVRGEVNAPSWFETLTQDYGTAVPFYRDVFGWDTHVMSDTDEFRYTTLGKDRDARAGIMDGRSFLGEEPSRWQFYIEVPDCDAIVEKATARGATVVQEPSDSPYGRLAFLRDAEGCLFAVMSNPQS